MSQEYLELDKSLENLTGQQLFFRVGSPTRWTGTEFSPSELESPELQVMGCWEPGEAKPQNPVSPFLEAEVREVGKLNGFFSLLTLARPEDWRVLQVEAKSLRESSVTKMPYAGKSNGRKLYIVPRKIALAKCMQYRKEWGVQDLLVPVRDTAWRDENPVAFHGFMSGVHLLVGLQEIL